MFHKISEELDLLHMSISSEQIKHIVSWGNRYGDIVNLNEFNHKDRKSTKFCITFDDGYKNNLKFVEYCPGIKATIFLATSYIGTGKYFWADKLQSLVLSSKDMRLDLGKFDLGYFELASTEDKKKAILELDVSIKRLHPILIEKVIREVNSQLNFNSLDTEIFLSWDDVKYLNENGIDIGSHTHNHVITNKVTRAELEKELQVSNAQIYKCTNQNPLYFAYPNGTINDICDSYPEILSEFGYKAAVTTIEGCNDSVEDKYLLKRLNMTPNRITTPFGNESIAMFTTLLTNPFGIH